MHHHTVDNKEHHSVDNIPHFPKIERNKKIIEDRLPEFDDRSIHEKIQLIKDKKKKKFSLLELNSPSSTLL